MRTPRQKEARRAACRKYYHKSEVGRLRSLATSRKVRGLPEPTRPMPELCECGCGRRASRLDHDHRTGKFRGWLSHQCNVGAGMLGDTVEGLMRMVEYIKRGDK